MVGVFAMPSMSSLMSSSSAAARKMALSHASRKFTMCASAARPDSPTLGSAWMLKLPVKISAVVQVEYMTPARVFVTVQTSQIS